MGRVKAIADSGASNTFCNNRDMFVEYEEFDSHIDGFTVSSWIKGKDIVE